jgi:hypothetical protein
VRVVHSYLDIKSFFVLKAMMMAISPIHPRSIIKTALAKSCASRKRPEETGINKPRLSKKVELTKPWLIVIPNALLAQWCSKTKALCAIFGLHIYHFERKGLKGKGNGDTI